MDWLSLDPTTICVLLLIISLTLLWMYVSMVNRRRQQPNLSILFEQTSSKPNAGSQSLGKKTAKNRGKSKQVDSSPRPVKQSKAQAEKTGEPVESSKPKKQTPQQSIQEAKSSGIATVEGSKSSIVKPKVKGKQGQSIKAAAIISGSVDAKTTEDIGEWKTQLSRQQLRLLRQKQHQEKDKTSSSDSDSRPASVEKKLSSGGEDLAENESGKSQQENSSSSGGNGTERRTRASSKRQKKAASNSSLSGSDKSSIKALKSDSGSNAADDTGQTSTDTSPGTESSSSPELRLTTPTEAISTAAKCSDSISDVELALKEAAHSSVSSVEEEKVTGSGEFTTVKHQKQKKSRRKKSASKTQDVPTHDQPPPSTSSKDIDATTSTATADVGIPDDDDWVHVVIPG